jgi:tetratricopeptide (TPR) repeat protein
VLTEDYIIRQINLAIATLLQILGLKKKGDYQTALELIDLAFEQLLGLRASMAKNLDDERLYLLLTSQERLDARRLAVVADLFQEEGDIYALQGRAAESAADYTRALRYNLEVLFNESDVDRDEIREKVETLAGRLDLATLGAETLWPLAGYYEENGAYARAEAALRILAGRPETRAEVLPEVVAFYRRLLDLPPEKITAGEISPDQVKERLRSL